MRIQTFDASVLVEEIDTDAGTFTARDKDGKLVSERPLAPEEIERWTPPPPAPAAAVLAFAPDDAAVAEAASSMADALDPKTANPTTTVRLAALETLVADLLSKASNG